MESSTHLSVSTTNAKGRVGDTVSIRVTVKNHGPAVEPEWALTGVETQQGTKFVSGTGCRPDPNGGRYCASPGPLAVGASQTVVLRYKIVKTVQHPEWQFAGFGFYEALVRKGGTDDVDLNFQIYIMGAATPTTRAPAPSGATPAPSSTTPAHASATPTRSSATPVRSGATPTRSGPASATPSSSPAGAIAASASAAR